MKNQSDTTLVLGAGVVGVCCAYYLAEEGREVLLLDKGEVCSGASYGNAGLLLPSHSVPLAAPGAMGKGLRWLLDPESPFYIKPRVDPELLTWLWRFAAACKRQRVRKVVPLLRDLQRASLSLYEELVAREGLQCSYARKGAFMLYNTEQAYEEGLAEANLLSEHGIEFKRLDGEAVREVEPRALPSLVGGVFYPEDAHLSPADFVVGMAQAVERKGVRVHTKAEVIGFDAAPPRITAVRTTRGDFEPAEIVLAAGAWSAELVREIGLRLPVQPAKGYSITVKAPEACPTVPSLLNEVRVAVTPMGETLRFAGTLELTGLDLSINRRRVEAILKGARAYVDGLKDLEVLEIWRGLRPCTPDGLPIVGRSALYENLILATGHATIGQALGPITGRLVAQIICKQRPEMDITPLTGERF